MAPRIGSLPLPRVLSLFVSTNILFIVIFWAIRIPLMTKAHHAQFPEQEGELARVGDALFHSIMIQTTAGSTSIVPLSPAAKVVTGLQSLTALGSVLLLFVVAAAHA